MTTHTDQQRPARATQTDSAPIDPALTRGERMVARALPSMGDVVFVCVLLGALFGLQGKILGPDGDLGWGLRIGESVLSHGIPRTEFMLSSTLGHPVVYWEWLSQTLYALADRAWGLNGVAALAALLVACASLLLYQALRRRGVSLALALPLTVLGVGLTSITWTARAQLFSLVLTVLWSELLWRYWRGGDQRILFALPPLVAFWANLHGGFLAGLILLGTATVVALLFPTRRGRAQPRALALTLLVSALATLVNPWGPGLWAHIASYAANPLIPRYTQEYQSPDFHSAAGLLFLALAFAVAAVWLRLALLRARTRHEATSSGRTADAESAMEPLALAHVAVWTALAFTSVRFVPLWALIALPILGESLTALARLSPESPLAVRGLVRRFARLDQIDAQVGRAVWSAIAVLVVVATLARGGALPGTSTRALDVRFDARILPVAAVERLKTMRVPPGQGFTTFAWGGYLDLTLPEYHVIIDSRSDDYSQQLLADYAAIVSLAPGWQTLLERHGVRWALLPSGDALTQALQMAPNWRCARVDAQDTASLCRRVSSSVAALRDGVG